MLGVALGAARNTPPKLTIHVPKGKNKFSIKMPTLHNTWWTDLPFKVRDDLIQGLYLLCQQGVDIDSVISERIHDLETKNKELEVRLEERNSFIEVNSSKINEVHSVVCYKGQQVELGNDGESLIDDLLYSRYSNCTIEDTSGTRNKGDRIVHFGTTRILIEVKNVKQETLSGNMKKYTQQITTDLLKEFNSGIKIGLLVSTRNVTFPGGDYFKFESINNKSGIVYCSNVKQEPFLLYSAIDLAKKLTELLDMTEDENIIRSVIRGVISTLNLLLTNVTKDQTTLVDMLENNKAKRAALESIVNDLIGTVSGYNDSDVLLDVYTSLDPPRTEKKLKDACIENGIPVHNIKLAGGLKALKLKCNKN